MSEHPCLGVALLCPAGDGVVKIVSKNCMIHLILSVNRYRLDIHYAVEIPNIRSMITNFVLHPGMSVHYLTILTIHKDARQSLDVN